MKVLDKAKILIRKAMFWRRLTPALLITALAGVLITAGVVGTSVGSASDMPSECDDNTIMRCGASNPDDFIANVRANTDGVNGDLPTVYAHFGLISEADYQDFADTAKQGTMFRDGRIEVDGQKVAEDGTTMGRQDFGNDLQMPIGGTTYFYNTPEKRWKDGVESLPVMVWFDKEGTVKTAILNPCGNPVPTMKRIKSGAVCDDLIKEQVKDKKNTYRFTTDAHKFGFAEFIKFQYFVDEGNGEELFATTENAETPVERTFTKDATVRVKILISVPGDQQRTIVSDQCVREIKVEKEKPKVPVQVLSVKKEKPPVAALPVTGPEGLTGLFAGVSAAGAIGHHLYARRGRKQQK